MTNNAIQDKYDNFREKIDEFDELGNFILNQFLPGSKISSQLFHKDYLNYHKVLLYNFIDNMQKEHPNYSDKQIFDSLINNFHAVVYQDLLKKLDDGKSYKDFFNFLVDIHYFAPVHQMTHHFHLWSNHTSDLSQESLDAIFFMQICLVNQKYFFKNYAFNISSINSFYLINEMGLVNELAKEHIPNLIIHFIKKNFQENKDIALFLNTANIANGIYSKEQKKLLSRINDTICNEMLDLKDEEFLSRFEDTFKFMFNLDNKIISKPIFKTMFISKIENLSQNYVSFLLNVINKKDKTTNFQDLKSETLNFLSSKLDISVLFKEEKKSLYYRTLIFESDKYNLIFPKKPKILHSLEYRNLPFIRFETGINDNSGVSESRIEFLTEKELLLSQKQILDLINEETDYTNIEAHAKYFLNKLLTMNDSYIREKELNERISNIDKSNGNTITSKKKI